MTNPATSPVPPPQWQPPHNNHGVPFGMPPEMMRPSVGFNEAFRLWSKNLFVFNGRAGQSEFWWVYGSLMIFFCVSFIALYMTFFLSIYVEIMQMDPNDPNPKVPDSFVLFLIVMVVYLVLGVLFFVLTLGLGWRRLQDAGFPGALWLLCLVGLGVVPTVLAFFPSSPNGLKYEVGAVRS
ncbi:MAG: DUF805 domain-containing protein [Rothia sp. (in: high G+C Gram-positive bacteria)]|nr:DUF805 domain-containing protein [Rothia sp. (in: high G+C Gram-positive bacteria)]